jgi:hypothetical protein
VVCDIDEEGSAMGLELFLRWIFLRFFFWIFWEVPVADREVTIWQVPRKVGGVWA